VVALLLILIQVEQEAVASGHILEPLSLQAHGRDAGRGRRQESVAVQLPGMAGDPQGEGLARPGPPHDHRNPLAALAQVVHHRLLIRPGSRVRGQGLAHRLMGDHGRVLLGPAGSGGDQPLLDRQQVRVDQRRSSRARSATTLTARSAKNRSANSSSSIRPTLASSAPRATSTSGRGEGGRLGGQPVRAGQAVKHWIGHLFGHRPVLLAVGCPAGHLPDQGVRVVCK
jgi:hypothetical protein